MNTVKQIRLSLNNREYFLRSINIGIFIIFCSLVISAAVFRQAYDWDMVAYIALSLDETSGPEIHRITWDILESKVPQHKLEALKGKGSYEIRANWHENSDDFVSLLPLYEIKAGYVMLLRQLSKLTDPVLAMQLVSASSALTGALMVFLVFLPIRGIIG